MNLKYNIIYWDTVKSKCVYCTLILFKLFSQVGTLIQVKWMTYSNSWIMTKTEKSTTKVSVNISSSIPLHSADLYWFPFIGKTRLPSSSHTGCWDSIELNSAFTHAVACTTLKVHSRTYQVFGVSMNVGFTFEYLFGYYSKCNVNVDYLSVMGMLLFCHFRIYWSDAEYIVHLPSTRA